MDNQKIEEWFNAAEWKQGFSANADESVDPLKFYENYKQHADRWNKAFSFLASINPDALPAGKQVIDGDKLFANFDSYEPKAKENTRFEAHRKYADIQYLIHGQEYIGILPLSQTTETVPYDSTKDVGFQKSEKEANYRLANSKRFFIFFPDESHRPCIKIQDNEKVNKVVMKVALD